MIISSGRQYIFIHAPKTGGTALSLALEGRAMKDDILVGDTPKAQARRKRQKDQYPNVRLNKHSKLPQAQRLVEDISGYYCFMLVRNPWDRLVSYYYWLQAQRFAHPAVKLSQTRNFSEFIREKVIVTSLRMNGYATYLNGAQDPHFLRLESLDQDLSNLWEHLGFTLSPIAHMNSSEREKDYRSYYSDEDAAHAGHVFAADVEQFQYKFSD